MRIEETSVNHLCLSPVAHTAILLKNSKAVCSCVRRLLCTITALARYHTANAWPPHKVGKVPWDIFLLQAVILSMNEHEEISWDVLG